MGMEKPTRKLPPDNFTGRPSAGLPRASSLAFTRIPGTFSMPPPPISAETAKVNSSRWLAGSDASVLRRSDHATNNFPLGDRDLATKFRVSGLRSRREQGPPHH